MMHEIWGVRCIHLKEWVSDKIEAWGGAETVGFDCVVDGPPNAGLSEVVQEHLV